MYNSYDSADNQNKVMAGTCLWGDGELVSSLVDTATFDDFMAKIPVEGFDEFIKNAVGEEGYTACE